MAERFGVVKFKGVEPETFWILLLDLDFQQGKPFMTTSDPSYRSATAGKVEKHGSFRF